MPRFFKRYGMGTVAMNLQLTYWHRLFKFPQMDYEMAVWEMTHLLIAPKKVFKSIYYHKRWSLCPQRQRARADQQQKPATPGTVRTHPLPTSSHSSSF
jgi:hypothetical protein